MLTDFIILSFVPVWRFVHMYWQAYINVAYVKGGALYADGKVVISNSQVTMFLMMILRSSGVYSQYRVRLHWLAIRVLVILKLLPPLQ